MKNINKRTIIFNAVLSVIFALFALSAAYAGDGGGAVSTTATPFEFEADAETFRVAVISGGVKETASEPLKRRKTAGLMKSADAAAWNYPDDGIGVVLKKEKDHLRVNITSDRVGSFGWPNAAAMNYTLPLWEGKYIPAGDAHWKKFLKGRSMSAAENFSMRFFALNKDKYAIVYIIENMFNNEIDFAVKDGVRFVFTHEFTATNKVKEYGFRIYVTANDPVSIANVYKNYVKEKGEFASLEDKAKTNANIRKLYGAPHIYLWEREFIAAENIDWKKFRTALSAAGMDCIRDFIKTGVEDGSEVAAEWDNIKKQDFVSEYQKNAVLSALNHALLHRDFYKTIDPAGLDSQGVKLAARGADNLNLMELYDLNKRALKSRLKDAIDPMEKWGNGNSLELLDDIRASGIANAWLGFGMDWIPGLINPEFVKKACEYGYLIGPYDSYHSIHDKCDPEWITAYFDDPQLYENATVTGKKGAKIGGFLGRGRQLNPSLSMPAVRSRMDGILNTGVKFNSWFIDCDAYGEFFDDYTPGRMSTQADDMAWRLKRMEYIRDKKNMVVGSELGNDYAARTIAFAHGLETPVIGYDDKDMKKDKNSKYYLGQYWSPGGGVSPIYAKQVPIKEIYRRIYLDPVYSLPLYKLVYNDCVITTHHWEFGSLKFSGEVENRMLYEFLYNVPPLYHIDRKAWKKNRGLIVSHVQKWSPFHKKAVTMEMTGFEILSDDRLVQSTRFGKTLRVVANFSGREIKYLNDSIKPKTLVIYDDAGSRSVYEPHRAAAAGE